MKDTDIDNAQAHNEREKSSYVNQDIVPERTPYNVHFKTPTAGYKEMFEQMRSDGVISTRGLKVDAEKFGELIFDVNSAYFFNHGGYEFAKQFYTDECDATIEIVRDNFKLETKKTSAFRFLSFQSQSFSSNQKHRQAGGLHQLSKSLKPASRVETESKRLHRLPLTAAQAAGLFQCAGTLSSIPSVRNSSPRKCKEPHFLSVCDVIISIVLQLQRVSIRIGLCEICIECSSSSFCGIVHAL